MLSRKAFWSLVVAAFGVGLVSLWLNVRGHEETHRQLAIVYVQQRATDVVRQHILNHPFKADDYFCRQQQAVDLCKVLQTKQVPDLGSHNDLWVSLDAIYMLQSSSELDRLSKAELNAKVASLYMAVANYNSLARQLPGDESLLGSNELYQGILGQAALCLAMPEQVDCTQTLPRSTAEALNQVLSFVIKEGPAAATYDMRNRVPSAENVLKNWLKTA